jgi:hypothetical protein
MAGGWSTQRVDDLDDIDAWMAQRNANIALRQQAEAMGRDLWDQGTRDGQDVSAAQPSDVAAIGSNALSQQQPIGSPDAADQMGSGDGGYAMSLQQAGGDLAASPPLDPGPIVATPPSYRFAPARPGDSISGLLGTSDPGAIGRFVGLNGLDGRGSTLQIGRSYAVPTRFDDASPGEVAAGNHLLWSDNARLAAAPARAANDVGPDLFAQRLNSGRNVWTGEITDRAAPLPTPAPRPHLNWWDQSSLAKGVAGGAALAIGGVAGLARGGLHTVQGIGTVARLFDPLDPFFSAPGDAAWDHVIDTGNGIIGYADKAISDPGFLSKDLREKAHQANVDFNPLATPMADTLPGEVRRDFHIGANDGEAAFDVGSLFVGGEFAQGLSLTAATKAADTARYLKLGLSPEAIAYLNEPYVGMGHHNVPRRFRFAEAIGPMPLPDSIAGKPLPKALSDSIFNVSKPEGITRGQMYAYHYRVDPKFHGAWLPDGPGRGWSGKKLGLSKYGLAERLWYGAPDALRAPGGVSLASGAATDLYQNDWDAP